jgi:hypothetical protein
MITSLGFDTVLIHTNGYSKNISQTVELLYPLGIKNYIFLFDYDPLSDSIPIIKANLKKFKSICSDTVSHHIKIKCALNLHVCNGSAFNPSVDQIYADKRSKAIFTALPIFADVNYQSVALDINHLLYKKLTFPIFTGFDKIIESSNYEFCSKFINNSKIGIAVDLNYLLDPKNQYIFKEILKSNSLILPSISHDVSNYAGIKASAEFIIDQYGKKSYYALCSQINKCSSKISL